MARKGFFLQPTESGLFLAVHHLRKSIGMDITQAVLGEDKVITAVHIAIMLHNDCMAAFLGIHTNSRRYAHLTGQSGIKDIHECFPYIVLYPFVENGA